MFGKKQQPIITNAEENECSCFTGSICSYHANRIDRWSQRDNRIEAKRPVRQQPAQQQNEETYYCGRCRCHMPIGHFPH